MSEFLCSIHALSQIYQSVKKNAATENLKHDLPEEEYFSIVERHWNFISLHHFKFFYQ